jgi:hypothetical protein
MPIALSLVAVAVLIAGARPAAAATPPAPRDPPPPTAAQTAATVALFRRDRVLMNWALRFFDTDGDVTLSPTEAAAAAAAFRKLADVDRDGRITPTEYQLARHYILTRY